jgi:hypothetical protein
LQDPEAAKKRKAVLAKAQEKFRAKQKQVCKPAFSSGFFKIFEPLKFYFCNQDPETAKKRKADLAKAQKKFRAKQKQVCKPAFSSGFF